jgi:AcrR family transcriptional regulator
MPEKATVAGKKTRGKRNPDGTREAILEAAGKLLAKDGPEGLSVSQVAQSAGVNRGTAYQHFQTRDQLLNATTAWVSEKLCQSVFGDLIPADGGDIRQFAPQRVCEHLADFAMENPELGRVWLFEVLSSSRPAADPFWKYYRKQFERFAQSDNAQPGIDCDVHAVLTLTGVFLWPVFASAHVNNAKGRQQLARRFSNELLRLSLHGTMRPEKFPDLDARNNEAVKPKAPKKRSK